MNILKRYLPSLWSAPLDIYLGYCILGILAVVVPYIFIWTYVLPFAPSDAIIRRVFPSQYTALLILTLFFVTSMLFVGTFALGLFIHEKNFKEKRRPISTNKKNR